MSKVKEQPIIKVTLEHVQQYRESTYTDFYQVHRFHKSWFSSEHTGV